MGAGTWKAAAANAGKWCGSIGRYYAVVVWDGTCGEDLGTCRWEIRKKRRVNGDAGEHRIQIQRQQTFASCATHGTVGFVLFFLDLTHFFLDVSVLK